MDLSKRFEIHQQLGEGSFSKIYHAFDKKLKIEAALKVEKEDKHKKILKFEYEILKNLQGLLHVPKLYDFVENINKSVVFVSGRENQSDDGGLAQNLNVKNDNDCNNINNSNTVKSEGLNFIVMELLGKNVANYKKSKHSFDNLNAYDILLQMLDAIEQLHDRGYIHRDIKPTNFVVKENIIKSNKNKFGHVQVYMVDYGLSKIHLDRLYRPIPPRLNTDFRGTLTYASLNAHYKKELSRRDDLWSFFFVILDLLNENLPWRTCKDDKEDIKKVKEICLADPEKKLLLSTTKAKKEILDILNHIKSLNYVDRPNYNLIRIKLNELRMMEISKFTSIIFYLNNGLGMPDWFFTNSNFNNNSNLNSISQLNNIGINNIKNLNNFNNFSNLNKNYGFYEFNNKVNEIDSPTKNDFLVKNMFVNSSINKNGLDNNNNNINQNLPRTSTNFTSSANYFLAENLQNHLNLISGNNSNLGSNLLNNGVKLNLNSNTNSNIINGNNMTNNAGNNFSSKNHLNLSDNYNLNYLSGTQNYIDLTKKLYLDNLMQVGIPSNAQMGLENNNTSNIYSNIFQSINMNLAGYQNNFMNNFANLNDSNNFTGVNSNINGRNNLNMGCLKNLNNLTDLQEINNYSNFQLPTTIGTLFNNQLQHSPYLCQNLLTTNIEEKLNENFNLSKNNSTINKKRKRPLSNSDEERSKTRNEISTQQQNQIFIINQFTKNQPTEFESKLVDLLMKQTLENEINKNSVPTKTKEKDNDKLLINSIIQKLKPSDKKIDINNNDRNHNLCRNNSISDENHLISKIGDLFNNYSSVEVDQLIKSVLLKSTNSTHNLEDNYLSNLIKSKNSISNCLDLIKMGSGDQSNSKIFKIEKKVKK